MACQENTHKTNLNITKSFDDLESPAQLEAEIYNEIFKAADADRAAKGKACNGTCPNEDEKCTTAIVFDPALHKTIQTLVNNTALVGYQDGDGDLAWKTKDPITLQGKVSSICSCTPKHKKKKAKKVFH